jgi:hypothetical protein
MKMIKSFIKKYIFTFRIEILLFISLILSRILKIVFSSSFEADEARDLLVARHMSFYGESPIIGHHMGGIDGLYHSLNYYSFLEFLTRIQDNPYFIFTCFAFLSIIAGILLYLGTLQLFDRKIAIVTTFAYTISPQFIIATNVWGAYLSFLFHIYAYYFFALFIKKKLKIFLFVHILIFAYACSISPFGLPFALFYIVIAFSSVKMLFIESFLYLTSFLYINRDHFIYFFDKYSAYIHNVLYGMNLIDFHSFLLEKSRIVTLIFRDMIGVTPKGGFFLLILIGGIYVWNHKKIQYKIICILITYFIWLYITIISLFFPGRIWTHHLLLIYLLLYHFMVIVLVNIYKINRLLIVTIFITYLIIPKQPNLFPNGSIESKLTFPYNSLKEFDLATNTFVSYIQRNKSDNFSVTQNNFFADGVYPVPEIYYFLERRLHKKMVHIIPASIYNIPEEYHTSMFFVCRRYWEDSLFHSKNCKKYLKELLPDYKLIDTLYTTKNISIFFLKKRGGL